MSPSKQTLTTEPRLKDSQTQSAVMLLDAKDRRTYEHVRQRVKKAADTVKMRAQKKKRSHSPPRPRFTAPRKGGGVLPEEDDVFDAVLIDSVNRGDAFTQAPPSSPRVDVKLSDLVTTRLPHKRNDSDFEVIPHIRSVIVLDDVATRDVPVDEPWEHIDGDDDNPVKAPTYATVLSSNK